MGNEIKVDLKIGRNQSGLSNKDVACLLGVDEARVSRLENGHAKPTALELCTLSFIYGRRVEDLYRLTTREVIVTLKRRLDSLPAQEPANWTRKRDQRLDTLNGLHERLREFTKQDHAA